MTRRHIELVTGSPSTPICIRLIHDRDKDALAVKLFGTIDEHWQTILDYQARGYGAFFVVNAGGDTDAEITKIRALFVDGDDIPLPVEWHLDPLFVNQRDATHWHAYWLVSDLPVSEFRIAQKRLAQRYGGDQKVCNPSRVMRLAGTLNHKATAQ